MKINTIVKIKSEFSRMFKFKKKTFMNKKFDLYQKNRENELNNKINVIRLFCVCNMNHNTIIK